MPFSDYAIDNFISPHTYKIQRGIIDKLGETDWRVKQTITI